MTRKTINDAEAGLKAIADMVQWVFDNIAIDINELDTEQDQFRVHMLKMAKKDPAKFSSEARKMLKERQKEQADAKRLVDDDRAILDAIGRAEREVISRHKDKWKRWFSGPKNTGRTSRVSKNPKKPVVESAVPESDH